MLLEIIKMYLMVMKLNMKQKILFYFLYLLLITKVQIVISCLISSTYTNFEKYNIGLELQQYWIKIIKSAFYFC